MANTYSLIQGQTVSASGGATTIVFSSIPQGYTDLCVLLSGRDGSYASALSTAYMTFNGNTANYNNRWLFNNSGTTGTSQGYTSGVYLVNMPGTLAASSVFGNVQAYITNYSSTTTQKTLTVMDGMANTSTSVYFSILGATWADNSAITSITLAADGKYAQYSTAYLYGIYKTA